jgi:hypothetical protein
MPARDVDRDGILPGDGGGANKRPPALGVKRPNLDGRRTGKYTRPAPSAAAAQTPRKARRPITRDLTIAGALVSLVALAFYGALGGHAAPPPGSNGTRDLTGMVDPRVTQNNIQTTICRRGWTRTVRPSRGVTDAIKRNLVADMRVSLRDYELEHIVPLNLGGAPLDLRNLMLQPWAGACNAHMKDDLERQLSIMVCAGDATLNGAQHEIATNWRAAYKKWVDSKGCGDRGENNPDAPRT